MQGSLSHPIAQGEGALKADGVGAQTIGNAWNGLAARMEQAEHLLRLLEQSQRIQVFRQTLAREPLENSEH